MDDQRKKGFGPANEGEGSKTADKQYRDILKWSKNKDDNHLSPTIALYLYGRSFFLEDRPVAKEHQEAVTYWLGQAKKYWLQLANRQSQGHLALALQRFGDKQTPSGIMAKIKRAVIQCSRRAVV